MGEDVGGDVGEDVGGDVGGDAVVDGSARYLSISSRRAEFAWRKKSDR